MFILLTEQNLRNLFLYKAFEIMNQWESSKPTLQRELRGEKHCMGIVHPKEPQKTFKKYTNVYLRWLRSE